MIYEGQMYEGKVAVVTGGTSGVGEAVARALAGAGAAGLVLAGRDHQRGDRVAGELTDLGCPTVFAEAHLEQPEHCRAIVGRAIEEFGFIDGLANCAAVNTRGTLDDTTVELWDHHMAVNVRAPFLTTQEAARHMKTRGHGGSIVNILSMSAHGGQPFLTAYSTSKGALATFTKNAAHSLRFDRIRVNGICLGWADTPYEDAIQRSDHEATDGWLERASDTEPMGKLAQPTEIAQLVLLMLSDAGGIMTGSLVDYDQNVPGCSA
jgi:NAD(P)-dependent dehydrogenase (short-subunit alcohol dehydrogenase family)